MNYLMGWSVLAYAFFNKFEDTKAGISGHAIQRSDTFLQKHEGDSKIILNFAPKFLIL